MSEVIYQIGDTIQRAIKNFVDWVGSNVSNFMNWMWNTISSTVIQPIQQALQSWFTRFVQKLPQAIFIITTIPLEVRLARSFIRNPSARTFLGMVVAPFAGLFASELIARILQAYLGAVPETVAPIPPTPVSPPSMTGYAEQLIYTVDKADVRDEASIYTIAAAEIRVIEDTSGLIVDTANIYTITPGEIKVVEDTRDKIIDSVSVTTEAVAQIAVTETLTATEEVEII